MSSRASFFSISSHSARRPGASAPSSSISISFTFCSTIRLIPSSSSFLFRAATPEAVFSLPPRVFVPSSSSIPFGFAALPPSPSPPPTKDTRPRISPNFPFTCFTKFLNFSANDSVNSSSLFLCSSVFRSNRSTLSSVFSRSFAKRAVNERRKKDVIFPRPSLFSSSSSSSSSFSSPTLALSIFFLLFLFPSFSLSLSRRSPRARFLRFLSKKFEKD